MNQSISKDSRLFIQRDLCEETSESMYWYVPNDVCAISVFWLLVFIKRNSEIIETYKNEMTRFEGKMDRRRV